jgi:hypothetical protein
MKNLMKIAAVLLVLAGSFSCRENNDMATGTIMDGNNDSVNVVTRSAEGWDYPLKPGTDAWYALPTEQARIAAVQIPDDVLADISTADLLRLVITFPMLSYVSAFDSPQQGFQVMLSRFNVFPAFLARQDIGKNLVEAYQDANMTGFKTLPYPNTAWTVKMKYIELLLAQDEVIQSLTASEKLALAIEANLKYKEKKASTAFASMSGIQPSARILVKILASENNPALQQSENKHWMDVLAQTGVARSFALMEEIVQISDNIINQ